MCKMPSREFKLPLSTSTSYLHLRHSASADSRQHPLISREIDVTRLRWPRREFFG